MVSLKCHTRKVIDFIVSHKSDSTMNYTEDFLEIGTYWVIDACDVGLILQ
jgi:hypothetical protein